MTARVVVFCAAVWLASALTGASAQEAASAPRISLSPAVIELHARFGESTIQTITLVDGTARALSFAMEAEDVAVRHGKRVYVRAGELPHSIAASAIFSQNYGRVGAYSSKAIQVRLTVPDRTDIRAVVLYFRAKNVAPATGLVSLNASLGALVTFTLSDDVAVSGSRVLVHPATASENLRVVEVLANTGSEPVVAGGVAAFIDARGRLAAKIPFQRQRLLPGEHKPFAAAYAGELRTGRYRVICTFAFDGRTLTRTAVYGAR